MNTPDDPMDQEPLAGALDQALARSLQVPALPAGFRLRLQAAVARSATTDPAQRRAALEQEHRAQLARMRDGYVQLRRRTLGTLIGAAFAAGLLITLALPWITAHFGRNGVFALPAIGVAVGLALSLRAWWQSSSLARWLP